MILSLPIIIENEIELLRFFIVNHVVGAKLFCIFAPHFANFIMINQVL